MTAARYCPKTLSGKVITSLSAFLAVIPVPTQFASLLFEAAYTLGNLAAPEFDFNARPDTTGEFQYGVDFITVRITVMPHVPTQCFGKNAKIVPNR